MKLHGNARTCPRSRALLVRRVEAEGWSLAEAAAAAGVSERTAAKWRARYRAEGVTRADTRQARKLSDEVVDRRAEHCPIVPMRLGFKPPDLVVLGATQGGRMRQTRPMPPGLGPPSPDRTRIVIADDDPLFVEKLRTALSAHDEFDVVGTAENGEEAIARVKELRPSVLLIDVAMPVLDGVEATRQIRNLPDPPAVVLITGEDAEADSAAYEAGAIAYFRKAQDLSSC